MAYQLGELFWFGAFVLGLLYWWSAKGVKEIAVNVIKLHCKKMDVQLLDESVVLRRYWFKRNVVGNLQVWRSFHFEFTSTGVDRFSGRVIFLGKKVLDLQLEPHRI